MIYIGCLYSQKIYIAISQIIITNGLLFPHVTLEYPSAVLED